MSAFSDPSAFDLESILRGEPKPIGAPPVAEKSSPAPTAPSATGRKKLGAGLLSARPARAAAGAGRAATAPAVPDAAAREAQLMDEAWVADHTSETLIFDADAIVDAGAKPPPASGAPFALAPHHRVLLGPRLEAMRACTAALVSMGAAVSVRSSERRDGTTMKTLSATSEDSGSSVIVDMWSLPEHEGFREGVVVELRRAGGDKASFYDAVDAFQAALAAAVPEAAADVEAAGATGLELVRDVTHSRVPPLTKPEPEEPAPAAAAAAKPRRRLGAGLLSAAPARGASGVPSASNAAVPAAEPAPAPARRRMLGSGLLSASPASVAARRHLLEASTTGAEATAPAPAAASPRRRMLGSGLLSASPARSATASSAAAEAAPEDEETSEWRSWLGTVESMLESRFADVKADGVARAARELADVAAAAMGDPDPDAKSGAASSRRARAWVAGLSSDGAAGRLAARLVRARAPGGAADAVLALSGLVCLAVGTSAAAVFDAGAAHVLCASVVRPAERTTVRSRRAATEALGLLAAADARVAEVAERVGATGTLRHEVATSAGGDKAMLAAAKGALASLRVSAADAALAEASRMAASAGDA